jgi:hypothetical protein
MASAIRAGHLKYASWERQKAPFDLRPNFFPILHKLCLNKRMFPANL